MIDNKSFEQGYSFVTKFYGGNISAGQGMGNAQKISDITHEISKLIDTLNSNKSNRSIESTAGFVFEQLHAATFNNDAIAKGSTNRAVAGASGTDNILGRNNYASPDVAIQNSKGDVVKLYDAKAYKSAYDTAKAQSELNKTGSAPKYQNNRLVLADQKDDVIKEADRLSTTARTEAQRRAYSDTSEKTVDRISDGVAESKTINQKDNLEIAERVNEGEVDKKVLRQHGIENEMVTTRAIMKEAFNAGLSTAIISAVMQSAPDIIRSLSYLIENKEIDLELLKRTGKNALKAGAEGFILGATLRTLQMKIAAGMFGKTIEQIVAGPLGSTAFASLVSLTFIMIKNGIMVATGKMKPKEMVGSFIDSVIISGGFLLGRVFTIAIPVVGMLLGSLIGTGLSIAYGLCKQKFISFCADTGFTCFGLVDQDYTLPEEVLADMGIDLTPINRVDIDRSEIKKISINNSVSRIKVDTVNLKVVKRGVIGVNRVGYVY